MRMFTRRRCRWWVALIGGVGLALALTSGVVVAALALSLLTASTASGRTAVEIKVEAKNRDGSQGCTRCKLNLQASGTSISLPDDGLTGKAKFKDASGARSTLDLDESEIQHIDGTFFAIVLRDSTTTVTGAASQVHIKLTGDPPVVKVMDFGGGLIVEFGSGETNTKIKLHP